MNKSPLIAGLACMLGLAGVVTHSGPGNAQSAPLSGETVFKQRCAACHTVVAGKPGAVGPNLSGVVGRKSGATSYGYSPAFKKMNIVWDKANLDRYLTSPAKMVPGSRMSVSLPDAKQRAAVIDYLSKMK